MNEAMEGLEDELDDLEDDAYGKNDAMIMAHPIYIGGSFLIL